MYTERVQYAIDNFIMDDYFLEMQNNYHLKEEKDSGKSDLDVTIKNDNLCIYNFDDKKKCNFLRPEKTTGMQKSVDHILFEKIDDGWRLHLIEMKSGVGYKTWLESIKPKVRTSYLTSLAIADFLGIGTVYHANKRYIQPLVEQGRLKLSIPDKPSSRKQTYTTDV